MITEEEGFNATPLSDAAVASNDHAAFYGRQCLRGLWVPYQLAADLELQLYELRKALTGCGRARLPLEHNEMLVEAHGLRDSVDRLMKQRTGRVA